MKQYVYHFDYYAKIKNVTPESPFDNYEVIENMNPTKHLIPLFREILQERGNWIEATKEQLCSENFQIDFAFTNLKYVNARTRVIYRIINDPNYITDKSLFYNTFVGSNFLVKSYPLEVYKKNPNFKNGIIIKPDLGQACAGIMSLIKYDENAIMEHINQFPQYSNWTVSEIFLPRTFNNYIVSNRIYLLFVSNGKDKTHKGYYYDKFLNYIPNNKFSGDVTDPDQFYTNYIGNCTELEFLKKRFIPHDDYMKSLCDDGIFESVNEKLKAYFSKILGEISNTCYSTNENYDKGNNLSFHIYGADVLISKNGKIKILEVNSAPQIHDRYGEYKNSKRFDSVEFMKNVFEKTIDVYYENKNPPKSNHFVEVYHRDIKYKLNTFYIPKSVSNNYPFILNALKKYLKRTPNPYDKDIKLFYGLREPYIYNESAVFYYDEILNYLHSWNMRRSKNINKIQGITRYLASKDELYKRLFSKFGTKCHNFIPETFYVHYHSYEQVRQYVKQMFRQFSNVKKWIVKPVYGSRGASIKVFEKEDIKNIVNYICTESETEIDIVLEKCTIKKKYNYWVISKYMSKPHLFSNEKHFGLKSINNDIRYLKPSIIGKKYNLRFYVVLVMKELPTYSGLANFIEGKGCILNCYIFNEYLLYFSLLKYNDKKLEYPFNQITDNEFIESIKTTTNLENINRLSLIVQDPNFNPKQMKDDHTILFNEIYPKGSNFDLKIRNQVKEITHKTIESVKYDLRPINRFYKNYESCFNILAYDTLVDSAGDLFLIEINRGPDLMALKSNYGESNCQKMFEEIFKLVLTNKKEPNKLFEHIPIDYDLNDL